MIVLLEQFNTFQCILGAQKVTALGKGTYE